MVRITSARVHIDPPADSTSTTSSTVGWDCWAGWVRPAASSPC
jgi:hypothetical protein